MGIYKVSERGGEKGEDNSGVLDQHPVVNFFNRLMLISYEAIFISIIIIDSRRILLLLGDLNRLNTINKLHLPVFIIQERIAFSLSCLSLFTFLDASEEEPLHNGHDR